MAIIDLYLEGDGAFPELKDEITAGRYEHLSDNDTIKLSLLDSGMKSGKPSVIMAFRLPISGKLVLAETSLRLLQTAMAAINERYGDVT